jgi:hypothetical protein
MVLAVNSSLKLVRYLSNVHTWAISFLRHLANMSSMVPFWALTDSSFVPNLGPASEATPSGGGCLWSYWQLLTFHPTSFPSKTSSATNTYYSSLYIHHHSYSLYITFKQAITSFCYMINSLFHFFGSSWQAGCPRSLVSVTLIKVFWWGAFSSPVNLCSFFETFYGMP